MGLLVAILLALLTQSGVITDPNGLVGNTNTTYSKSITDPNGKSITDPNGKSITDPNGKSITDPNGLITDPNGKP